MDTPLSRAATSALLASALLLVAGFAPVAVASVDSPADQLGPDRHSTDGGFALLDPDEEDGEDEEDDGDEEEEEEGDDGESTTATTTLSASTANDTTTTTTTTTTATTTTSTTSTTTTTRTTTTTTQSDDDSVEVEFLNCSAVRLSGDVPEVEIGAFTYAPGIDTYLTTVGPFEGERVVDVEEIWDSPRGMVLDRVTTVGGGEPQIDEENPDLSECQAGIQPDRPTGSVASTERLDSGAIEVTFEYENPNDVALQNFGGGLDGRIVEGEAPGTLEPSTHTFTVEWAPVDESSRLTWTVELGAYGYTDDPLIVNTSAAGSIGGDETTTTTTTTTTTSTTTATPTTTATTTSTTTTPTTTPTTTATTSSSTGGDSASSGGSSSSDGSNGGSASTSTQTTRQTTATTEPSTPSTETEPPATTETTTTVETTTSMPDPTTTATDTTTDASTPRAGGSFARFDSSDAIQGLSLGIAATFGAMAFVAWRRQP